MSNRTARRGRGPTPAPLELAHGRRGTYVNRGCRCPRCTRANRLYQRGRRWR